MLSAAVTQVAVGEHPEGVIVTIASTQDEAAGMKHSERPAQVVLSNSPSNDADAPPMPASPGGATPMGAVAMRPPVHSQGDIDYLPSGNSEFPLQGPVPQVGHVGGKVPKTFRPNIQRSGNPPPGPDLPRTPLAQTPSQAMTSAHRDQSAGTATPAITVTPAPSAHPAFPSAPAGSHLSFGSVAAVVAPAEVILAGGPPAVVEAAERLASASNKATEVLAIVADPNAIGGALAYNFVHFNPAMMLNDAIAAFTAESASISPAAAPVSSARAWTITAAVIGLDVLFMGYWYQKARRDASASSRRTRAWGLEIEPCPRRLL
jgi:hypothetical protein